jgi:hypothetical protein
MATFVHDDGSVLTFRSVPALRVAIAFGLATSWLLHVFFELMEAPPARHEFRSALWLGTICIAVSCLFSHFVVLRFDRRSRTSSFWTASVLGICRRTMPFSSIRTAELSQTQLLPGLAVEWIVLNGDDGSLRLGGLGWLNVDRPRRRQWLGAVCEAVWPPDNMVHEPIAATDKRPLRFSLRRAVVAVFLAAVMLGGLGWMKFPMQSRFVLAMLIAGCTLVVTNAARWHALLLVLATHYLPFAWMIRVSVPWGTTSGLIESLPLVPAAWLALPLALAHVHPESGWWLCSVAPIQILGATWLASRNGRWMLAIWLVSFLLAALGSFIFYAGYRM